MGQEEEQVHAVEPDAVDGRGRQVEHRIEVDRRLRTFAAPPTTLGQAALCSFGKLCPRMSFAHGCVFLEQRWRETRNKGVGVFLPKLPPPLWGRE